MPTVRPLTIALAAAALLSGLYAVRSSAAAALPADPGAHHLADAFSAGRSGDVVEVTGTVTEVLADSAGVLRFAVAVPAGHGFTAVHRAAPGTVVPLARGDRVRLRGTYEWNAAGGILTGTSARGAAPGGGWLIHDGHMYY